MISREIVLFPSYAAEIVEGLMQSPKTLPPKLFYDAAGSALFDRITELPEYYLTRSEMEILEERAGEIVGATGGETSVVELGAGSAVKTCILLREFAAGGKGITYHPVDVSASALSEAVKRVQSGFPEVRVDPVIADYTESMKFLQTQSGRKLVLYLGSSIGNFEPDAASDLLRAIRKGLLPGDALLLGTDLVKDPSILVPAYDDAQGVTAEFNKNILLRINREFGASFDLTRFRHIAKWNDVCSRMEMYLESLADQEVEIDSLGLRAKFHCGETIHTENSYKYKLQDVQRFLWSSRFNLKESWLDEHKWYALHLAMAI